MLNHRKFALRDGEQYTSVQAKDWSVSVVRASLSQMHVIDLGIHRALPSVGSFNNGSSTFLDILCLDAKRFFDGTTRGQNSALCDARMT